ncbi:MAG: hypothetical protein E6Z24_06650 [Dialister sp.]|uniref:Sigma-70 family RNA polymerase sigma factor n=1 Tax=Atopobium minutum 10063974 TaxID=997872 RepID=N2BTW8_9ACTN|nr:MULTISPECIES: hypothetical protein [Atopobium]EMZ41963.1 hypothetical protein HMPREF1091_00937 [Atopobium minutum 10063974]MDU5357769.1 hypothetical protein [Atopobium minutum]MDU5889634.1 hypothetical protein [Dialister sp.]
MAKNYDNLIYYRDCGFIEVTPDVKKFLEKERDNLRHRMQGRHECVCPRERFNLCDTDCVGCPYHRNGIFDSIDAPIPGTEGLTLSDVLPDTAPSPEAVLAEKVLKESIESIKERCSDEELKIIEGLEQGKPKRQMAKILGIPASTYRDRKTKLLARLAREFSDLEDFL